MSSSVYTNPDANRAALHEANACTVPASRIVNGIPRYPARMPANVMLFSYAGVARASSVKNAQERVNDPDLLAQDNLEYLEYMQRTCRPLGVGGVTANQHLDGLLDADGFPIVTSETARRVRQCDDNMQSCFTGANSGKNSWPSLGPLPLYAVPTSADRCRQLYSNTVRSPPTVNCPTMRLVPLSLRSVRSDIIRMPAPGGGGVAKPNLEDENPAAFEDLVDRLGREHARLRIKRAGDVLVDPVTVGNIGHDEFFDTCARFQGTMPTGLSGILCTDMMNNGVNGAHNTGTAGMQNTGGSGQIIANRENLHLLEHLRVRVRFDDFIGDTRANSLNLAANGGGGAGNPARLHEHMLHLVRLVCAREAWHRCAEAVVASVRTPPFAPVAILCGALFREAVDAYILPHANLSPEDTVKSPKIRGMPIENAKVTVGLPRDNPTIRPKSWDGKGWDGGAMLLAYRVMCDDGTFPERPERVDVGVIDVDYILNCGLYEKLVRLAWNLVAVTAVPPAVNLTPALPTKGNRKYKDVPNKDLLHRAIMLRTEVLGGTNMDSAAIRTMDLTALSKGATGLRCASTYSAYRDNNHPYATQMRVRPPYTKKEREHCHEWATMTIVDPLTQKVQYDERIHFVPILTSSVEPKEFYSEIASDLRAKTDTMVAACHTDDEANWRTAASMVLVTELQTQLIAAVITRNVHSCVPAMALTRGGNENECRRNRKRVFCELTDMNFQGFYPHRNVVPISISDVHRLNHHNRREPLVMRVTYAGQG